MPFPLPTSRISAPKEPVKSVGWVTTEDAVFFILQVRVQEQCSEVDVQRRWITVTRRHHRPPTKQRVVGRAGRKAECKA